MSYQPIENYGVIGNMRTAALVGMNGAIDWLCLPHFDSPSVFAAILDDKTGGTFRISPAIEDTRHKQFYWPDTNILMTRFLHADGIGEVADYMPVSTSEERKHDQLVRRVHVVRGEIPFRMECRPAFDYARAQHTARLENGCVRFTSPELSLSLSSTVPLRLDGEDAAAEFTLHEGENAWFVLSMVRPEDEPTPCPADEDGEEQFRETVEYWHNWLAKCNYRGRWREQVQRSALVLKLLTFDPTGAIIAAPTTSLPEELGGVRNWDYRYCWVRDASFIVYALIRIGFTEEAGRFVDFLSELWKHPKSKYEGPLQLMYDIHGDGELEEQELSHLEGYKGSGPVRIGNGAYDQLQLDIYGALLDSVYLYNKYGEPVSYEGWTKLRVLVDWLCDHWHEPDHGVWEMRSEKQPFVYTRFMSWVAIDRALRLSAKRSLPCDRARWLQVRDTIYNEVMERGWSEERQSFVQAYGTQHLDSSVLIAPLVFFIAPNDPRMLATIEAIRQPHSRGGLAADGLIYRYDTSAVDDGLPGDEGTFTMCSFWLVEAMTRAGRSDKKMLQEARLLFEQMLAYANHLGLYAEQIGASGEALGNFPQGFTHLGLISAAYNLNRALGDE